VNMSKLDLETNRLKINSKLCFPFRLIGNSMIESNTEYTRFSYCLVDPARRSLSDVRATDVERKKKKKTRIRINRPLQRATHAYLLRLDERRKNTKLMQFCNYTVLTRPFAVPAPPRGAEECPRDMRIVLSYPSAFSS